MLLLAMFVGIYLYNDSIIILIIKYLIISSKWHGMSHTHIFTLSDLLPKCKA